jgi:preprotein translocase subunit SecG
MNVKNACAILLGTLFLVLFIILVIPPARSWPEVTLVSHAVGSMLWKTRTYEVLLQGMIVLAGVLSILLLLGRNQSGRMPP